MASITIQVTNVCAGGDHASVQLTKGAQVRNVAMNTSDLRGAITQDDIESFAKVALKLLSDGKTLNQFKTSAQNGFTVTI